MNNIIIKNCVKLDEKIANKLDTETVFILEHIGIPNTTPMGIDVEVISNSYLYKENNIVLGETKGEKLTHYLILNIIDNGVYFKWNYQDTPEKVFINSNIKSMLLCEFSYHFFIRRLISSKVLGAYYDNSDSGGNFEKYACLLEDIIKDIDERAAKEGVWHSLIEEMKLGVI